MAGAASSASGVSYCSSTPPTFSTATLSPSAIASSMSWVTSTIVLRTFVLQVEQLALEPGPHDGVDGTERLVHQQHRRVGGQGAGHPDPLLLAARELGRVPRQQGAVEAHEVDQLVDPGARSGSRSHPSTFGTVAMFWAIVRCGNRPTCWMT